MERRRDDMDCVSDETLRARRRDRYWRTGLLVGVVLVAAVYFAGDYRMLGKEAWLDLRTGAHTEQYFVAGVLVRERTIDSPLARLLARYNGDQIRASIGGFWSTRTRLGQVCFKSQPRGGCRPPVG
jgi:hypothetical protein